jgi:plasminogen activator inhibitor 1 RNA-binding protein
MTLEEYEKVLEEKRKALQALKTEGRKVDTKEFESMKPLSRKKENDEIFAKLVSFFTHPLVLLCSLYYIGH